MKLTLSILFDSVDNSEKIFLLLICYCWLEKHIYAHNSFFQVFLYDANRRLLDSRFLKSNEMISSGESLKLDGHLVEIGECEGDQKPLKDSNIQGKNCIAVGETKMLHEQVQSHANYPVGSSTSSN